MPTPAAPGRALSLSGQSGYRRGLHGHHLPLVRRGNLPASARFCPGCGTSARGVASGAALAETLASSSGPGVGRDADTVDRDAETVPDPEPHPPLAAAASTDPLIGATVAGRFKVSALLGAGGMGTVYQAEQIAVGRKVVLKFLHPHLFSQPDLIRALPPRGPGRQQADLPQHHRALRLRRGRGRPRRGAGRAVHGDGVFGGAPAHRGDPRHGARCRRCGPWPSPCRCWPRWRRPTTRASSTATSSRTTSCSSTASGTTDFVKVLDFGIAKLMDQPEAGGADEPAPRTIVGVGPSC